jgi:dTDP-4-dehydrorhamnose reductase
MTRVLLTGASGQLGAYLLWELWPGYSVQAWSGSRQGDLFGVPLRPVDLTDFRQVSREFLAVSPDLIIHTAALARVGDCERDPERARRINAEGTAVLADLAERARARLVLISTDLVFDGESPPYRETDPVQPLTVYARTKVEAEKAVLDVPRSLVVRVSLLFGPSMNGKPSFFGGMMDSLGRGQPLMLFADEWRTPLALTTAARALVAVAARTDVTGVLHLGGPERLSRMEMGQRLAAFLNVAHPNLVAGLRQQVNEPRPRDVSLDSTRWRRLFPNSPWPGWEEALGQMLAGPLK